MSDNYPPVESPVDGFGAPNPGWPKIVGIVSIVFSSLGYLCGICGVGFMLMMPMILKGAEEQMGPMPDIMRPGAIQIGMAALGFIPTTILMVAGIQTLRRSKTGAMAHLAYAAVGLLLGLASCAYAIYHQLEVQAWADQNSGDKWAAQAGSPSAWFGIVVAILFSLGYPMFCLIWFGLVKRNADMGTNEVSI